MQEAQSDLTNKRAELAAILAGRARITQSFEQHQDQLERAGNALLSKYRTANRQSRSSPPPNRFEEPWLMGRIAAPSELPDFVDQEIRKSQDGSVEKYSPSTTPSKMPWKPTAKSMTLSPRSLMPRLSRSRHRRFAGETGKFVAAVALALVTLVAAAWGAYLWGTAPTPIQRDRVTLCPDSPPQDIIIVVLDTTDGLPPPTKLEAMKLLTDLMEQSPDNAVLDVRVIDPAQKAGRPILTLCNPGDGRGISEFTGNPEMAKRVWRQRFREPLVHALEGGLQPVPSKTSPLLATFQAIALERFTGAKAEMTHKRLVIVSDMMEYVPGEYTQYPPADLRYDRFKGLPVYRRVRTDLHGAQVDILF